MRRWNILLLVILSAGFFPLLVSAQYEQDTVLAKDNSIVPLPTISVNVGFNHGFADVSLSNGPSPFRQFGYQLTISQRVAKFLDLGFELYSGTIYGEDQRDLVNINYRTSLVSPRVNIAYNFFPLLKPDRNGRQLVRPYVGFGLGALFFRSKGDLKDSNGNVYNYWSNGNIYAEAEGTVDVSEATQLTRDFEYETDLRDANLDGFRKYSQMAFTMPLQAGVRFQITKNFGVNAAFSYVLNFTDLIDNVNSESVGIRQGSSDFDNHLFGSIGISVFLGTTKPSSKPIPRFEEQIAETNKESGSIESVAVENKQASLQRDELEIISEKLTQASVSLKKVTLESKNNLKNSRIELASIAENSLETRKDLREAKAQSIVILEKSISQLSETNSELNRTAGTVNSLSSSLNNNNVKIEFSNTDRIRATVEETIPAIEALKKKVESAQNAAELKSILNISSKNLSHTKDIFEDESETINLDLVQARKTVATVRVEKLAAANNAVSPAQLESLREEIDQLLAEGIVSRNELDQMKKSIAQVDVSNTVDQTADHKMDSLRSADYLLLASQLLKNAIERMNETKGNSTIKLVETKDALDILAEKEISGRSELNQFKKASLEILEQALNELNGTSSVVSETEMELEQARELTSEAINLIQLVSTEILQNNIENSTEFLQSSIDKIQASKNSEQLKSVIKQASKNVDNLSVAVSKNTNEINKTLNESRQRVLESRLASALESDNEKLSDSQLKEIEIAARTLQVQNAENTSSDRILSKIDQLKERPREKTEERLFSEGDNQNVLSELQLLKTSAISILDIGLTLEESVRESLQLINSSVLNETQDEKSFKARTTETIAVLDGLEKQLNAAQLAISTTPVQGSEQVNPNTSNPVQTESLTEAVARSKSEIDLFKRQLTSAANPEEFDRILNESLKKIDSSAEDISTATGASISALNQQRTNMVELAVRELSNTSSEARSSDKQVRVKSQVSLALEDLRSDNLISKSQYETWKQDILVSTVQTSPTKTSDASSITANADNSKSIVQSAKGESKPQKGFDKKSISDSSPKETGDFHWADLNKNNWISPDEVLYFIDLLFEGDAEYDVVDVQNLIDYYFDQD